MVAATAQESEDEDDARIVAEMPTQFDWREERPECISEVQAQASCGSCYAFASAAMLAERSCL